MIFALVSLLATGALAAVGGGVGNVFSEVTDSLDDPSGDGGGDSEDGPGDVIELILDDLEDDSDDDAEDDPGDAPEDDEGGAPEVVDSSNPGDVCKNGGWVALGYKNQGQCVSYYNTQKH